jgi:preprotein translocase subunit SecD
MPRRQFFVILFLDASISAGGNAMSEQISESIPQQKSFLPKLLLILLILSCLACALVGAGVFYVTYGRAFLAPKNTVIFEPNLPSGVKTSQTDLEETARILALRWNALGYAYPWVSFTVSPDGKIIGQIPTDVDPALIERTKIGGLLEFVDFRWTPVPDGTVIITDFGLRDPTASGIAKHTILTGSDIKTISAPKSPFGGGFRLEFTLTENGKKIFADYTTKNQNTYLAIVLDKKVYSSPRINSPILDGSGVITGSFTQQSAQDFALYIRYGALPVPLR